ncbi:hypothetical protein SBF1_2370006 [Candidatus Desulfosporosinus infrequens]|uniref:Uncharacterized protein n=1 Tax=Candidatus Desulfosporosinus infrequens TaxID=2043169 RepID=A0A2U3KMK6_9FIRM|nr:hypothetical protein SBF1_2370006 [Candidatus Desulfosporosinus infrequens]
MPKAEQGWSSAEMVHVYGVKYEFERSLRFSVNFQLSLSHVSDSYCIMRLFLKTHIAKLKMERG